MKSLLVDVLRESQEDAPDKERPQSPAVERSEELETTATEQAEVGNLDLMATGQYEAASAEPGDSQLEPPADDVEEFPPEPDEPVRPEREMLADTTGQADTTASGKPGANAQARSPMIIRFGRMAPVLCLLSVVGVAGGYLALDKLTSGSLNEDLDELTGIVQVEADSAAAEMQRTRTSVFNAVGHDNEPGPEAETVEPNVERPKVTGPETGTGGSQRSTAAVPINVRTTESNAAAVEDSAYDLVVSAYAAYRQRDFELAEQLYDQALLVEPNHRDALLGSAAVYQQTARGTLAIAAYKKVLQVDPGNNVAAAAILSTNSSGSRLNNESDIKLLLQRYPDAHHFHFALGSIYVNERRWAEARGAFMSAYRLAPENANYSYNLAVSSERLGDLVEAVQYYETALANVGNDSNVDPAAIELHLSQLAIIARDDR
ncbi:MAG: tetratricopeptide repeat protein [Woeseiaceae bacterium]